MLKVLQRIPSLREPYALYLMIRDPRTENRTKISAGAIIVFIAAYTLSPLDFIPDAVPLLGWLDDLVLVPFGFMLIEYFLPRNIWLENKAKARVSVNRALLKVILGTLAFLVIWSGLVTATVFGALKLINH